MYIHPFIAGALALLLAEMTALIIVSIIKSKKNGGN